MPCYFPLRAVLVSGPEGRRLDFSRSSVGKALSLPCGRCIGCRLERARQWAVRIVHESKMHEESCFVTLTYDSVSLPKDGSLSVEHCQLFLKRLRSKLAPSKIRFFLCGEYGDKFGRPHYHAILFGYKPVDGKVLSGEGDFTLYDSDELSKVWGLGLVSFGQVSFDSACYVANYSTKKIVGSGAASHYQGRRPEFLLMSRRPGIGRTWFERFGSDVYPSDQVVVRGRETRPPRYYDNVGLLKCLQSTADILSKRSDASDVLESFILKGGNEVFVSPSRNARRLVVREKVAQAKLALKSRSFEDQS